MHRGREAAPSEPGSGWFTRSGLSTGLWFGAVVGLAEVAQLGFRRRWQHRLVFVPEYFWWSAPLVNGLIVATITMLAVALLWRWWPHHRARTRFSISLALAVAGTLAVIGGLHLVAVAALAIGVGVQGGALLARRAARVDWWIRMTLPIVAVLLPAAGAALLRLPPGASLPESPARSGLPNILLIVLDTVRSFELSLYGARDETSPELRELGARGVVFERAWSTSPWTAPAHASLFTGRWSHELAIGWQFPLQPQVLTLAEELSRSGYATVGIVANTPYVSRETGLARGFHHFEDYRFTAPMLVRLTALSRAFARRLVKGPRADDLPSRADADYINNRFLSWVDRRPQAPFFGFLNYYDAHAPYFAPEPHWSRFLPGQPRRPLPKPRAEKWDSSKAALQRRGYAAAIAHLDSRIGALLDSLERRQLLDQTLIIVTSDHGEEFLERGMMGHGKNLYGPSLWVPLVMAWPGNLPAGCRVSRGVSLRDVPATIMDLLDLQAAFPGRSLTELWRADGSEPVGRVVLSRVGKSLTAPMKYPANVEPSVAAQIWPFQIVVQSGGSAVELFDLRTDPLTLKDLSSAPWAQRLERELLDSLGAAGLPPSEWRSDQPRVREAPERPVERPVATDAPSTGCAAPPPPLSSDTLATPKGAGA